MDCPKISKLWGSYIVPKILKKFLQNIIFLGRDPRRHWILFLAIWYGNNPNLNFSHIFCYTHTSLLCCFRAIYTGRQTTCLPGSSGLTKRILWHQTFIINLNEEKPNSQVLCEMKIPGVGTSPKKNQRLFF